MKKLFIEARSNADVRLPEDEIRKLPERVGIITTVQHFHKIKDVQDQIKGSIVAGKVLGCDVSAAVKIKDKVDAFLYIGTGRFHPIEAAKKTGKDVYTYGPGAGSISVVDRETIKNIEKRRKGCYLKFLSSKNIGVIVSTKQGQDRMGEAKKLKEKRKDKNFFIFMADTIDAGQMENFPFIECWVNTACPRITEDTKKPVINIDDLGEK